jgi:hypothetical protein
MLKVSWFNRILFGLLFYIGCLDLFTDKDLKIGISFMIVIIVSYMMQIQKLKEDEVANNNPVLGDKLPDSKEN